LKELYDGGLYTYTRDNRGARLAENPAKVPIISFEMLGKNILQIRGGFMKETCF